MVDSVGFSVGIYRAVFNYGVRPCHAGHRGTKAYVFTDVYFTLECKAEDVGYRIHAEVQSAAVDKPNIVDDHLEYVAACIGNDLLTLVHVAEGIVNGADIDLPLDRRLAGEVNIAGAELRHEVVNIIGYTVNILILGGCAHRCQRQQQRCLYQ